MPPMRPANQPVPCMLCGYPKDRDPCPTCGGTLAAVRPGRGFVLGDLAHGFATFFQAGVWLLTRKEYFGKLAAAMAANVVVLVLLSVGIWLGVYEGFQALVAADQGWLDFLSGAVSWASGVLGLVLTVVVILLLGPSLVEVVLGPFLDGIADATEKAIAGPAVRPVPQTFWQSLVIGLRSTAQVLALQLLVLVPCLLLSLCGIGLAVAAVVSAFLNAVLWFEVPCARRGQGFSERWALVRANWARSLGFGLAFQLGLFVPLFNFVLLAPTAAAAVSALYFWFDKSSLRDRNGAGVPP